MDVVVDNEVAKHSIITGVPLSAFTCWQHGSVDVVTLSRLGSFMRRGAFQKGFIDRDLFKYRPELADRTAAADADAAGVPATQPKKTRFFVISCDIVVDADCPSEPTVMSDVARGELFLSGLGNSTFSLYLDLRTGTSASANGAEVPLGMVHMTLVCIDEATRRSTPLEPYRRRLLESLLNPTLLDKFRVAKMQRLERPSLDNSPIIFSHPMPVRDADTDFNGHLNQSMYIAFVVDAIKAFMRTREKELGYRPLRKPCGDEDDDANSPNNFTGVAPKHDATSSKIVRRFRIDYVREVPSRDARLTIHLQRMRASGAAANGAPTLQPPQEVGGDPRSPQVVSHTKLDDAHVHSLWFEVMAQVPAEGAAAGEVDPAFCAAQGTVEVHSKWL